MSRENIDLEAFHDFEHRSWNQRAAAYHAFLGQITDRVAEPLLDAARVARGTRVLDLATGPGYVASRAAARGAVATGIDFAATMVALAARQFPMATFLEADAEHLPFPDGSFDAVVGNFLLPHLGEAELAVGECRRALRGGGWLALSMWDDPAVNRLVGAVAEAVAEIGAPASPDVPAGPPTFRYSADAELRGLLESQGFHAIHIEPVRFDHRIPDTETYWRGIVSGTVRLAALVDGHPMATIARIREAFERRAAALKTGGDLSVPVAAKIVSGQA